MIETYTDIGDTVLDNTCGSDTTGIASFELGRNSISIENDLSIYNLAKKRREEKNKYGMIGTNFQSKNET